MKGLGRKNLYYSVLLASVMMLCLVGYFVLMLPSLYVHYLEEQNVSAVKEQHMAYVENGTYDGVLVKNPAACVSIKIPAEGNTIELVSKFAAVTITAADPDLRALLHDIQKAAAGFAFQDRKSSKAFLEQEGGFRKKAEEWRKMAGEIFRNYAGLPAVIKICPSKDSEKIFFTESFQVHAVSDQAAVLEAGAADENNRYTNYIVVEKMADGMVFSILPVVTPDMGEIRPVVMQSLPMLCAVILMMVLIFSQIYSSGIIIPVYQKLQNANQALVEENERQEVFLRASSHQLKTPVTAALLLLDGMISQVGKYKDTKKYLPNVKEQLLNMRTMIDKILSMNPYRTDPYPDGKNSCKIVLYDLVQELLLPYRVAAADKKLEILLKGDQAAAVYADNGMYSKILDSLLSNAVEHTPQGQQICISIARGSITVWNAGTEIPQKIMRHIFEPFVKGSSSTQSHGLGLYIADYYAKQLGAQLQLRNKENGVEAVFQFRQPR